jgi:hypothetical protein
MQVINVTTTAVRICTIAASGSNAATNATFTGTTFGCGAAPNQFTASLPVWTAYKNVSLDATWTDVSSIIMTTSGDPNRYTAEL